MAADVESLEAAWLASAPSPAPWKVDRPTVPSGPGEPLVYVAEPASLDETQQGERAGCVSTNGYTTAVVKGWEATEATVNGRRSETDGWGRRSVGPVADVKVEPDRGTALWTKCSSDAAALLASSLGTLQTVLGGKGQRRGKRLDRPLATG